MTRAKASALATFATKAAAEVRSTAHNQLLRQYVSEALPNAMTVGGTVKGRIRASESATAADMRPQIRVLAVTSTGATRGVLLAPDTGVLSDEFATSLVNRPFPVASPATLTERAVQAGDHIVVEIGYRAHNTSTTSRTGTLEFGEGLLVGDLPENSTANTQLCPWIEFSQDLFAPPAAVAKTASDSLNLSIADQVILPPGRSDFWPPPGIGGRYEASTFNVLRDDLIRTYGFTEHQLTSAEALEAEKVLCKQGHVVAGHVCLQSPSGRHYIFSWCGPPHNEVVAHFPPYRLGAKSGP